MFGAILQFVQRVRGDQDGGAVIAQFVQDLVEGLAQRRVEARGRLVQQQHAWPPEQGLGQAQPLPHPLGVGADPAIGGIDQADAVEQRHAVAGLIRFSRA